MGNSMSENLKELKQEPKYPNAAEFQEFLRNLHAKSLNRQSKMKEMIEDWQTEDRHNAAK